MIRRAFGNALRDVRELLKISQSELAAKAEIQRQRISEIERGKDNPRLTLQYRLILALNVDVLVFASEIQHHMAQLGMVKPVEIDFWSQIQSDGILSIKAISRIDAAKNKPFIERVFGMAKQTDSQKILMDLSLCLFHFSQEEQRQGAKHGLKWMEENSFWPVVAVVANSTLDHWGATIANEEGHRGVEIFDQNSEARQWLQKHTLQKS